MDTNIGEVYTKLGRVEGALNEHRGLLEDIGETVKKLAKIAERSEVHTQAILDHEMRLREIEATCAVRGAEMAAVKKLVPVEKYIGAWALRVVVAAGTMIIGWMLLRLPRILELLQ